jgi:hypothetical protein
VAIANRRYTVGPEGASISVPVRVPPEGTTVEIRRDQSDGVVMVGPLWVARRGSTSQR